MFFLVRLFIALGFAIICAGLIIDRPSKSGDVFSMKMNLLGKTVKIKSCSSDVHGSGSSTYKNSTACKCGYQQTFFVVKDVPKCMRSYDGDIKKDGLSCGFRFRKVYNGIKEVTPSQLTKSYDLGRVYYKNNAATKHDFGSALYWNMTWNTVEESQLFYFDKAHLKWTRSHSKALALKYSGLLFKLNIKADVNRNQQESCLLLKMTGSRNYPLPDPNKSESTSSTITIPSPSTPTLPTTSSKTASHSSSITVPTSTPTTNVNGNVGQQKESGSNTATIAGIAGGAVVAICVFGVVFFLYRRKYATKTESRKRKETMMLNLTSNTYSNNYNADTTRNGNATQKDLGNPMYDDKLVLGKEAKRPACNAYENRGPDLVSEPIYKEVEDEQPVYEETGDMYQPLSKNKPAVPEQDIYQPIDASSLSKSAQQVESPIYQVLDDPTAEEARSQSPIYHTVEADDYQAIDRSGVQKNEGFYAELNDQNSQAPLQEPLYRELDISVEGQVNVKYDDDEEAI